MKKLLFLLMFVPFFSFGQTADYELPAAGTLKGTTDHTIFYDIGIDTLSGTNDTLMITFDRSFPAHYGYNLSATWSATSTCTDGEVRLQGRNNANEDWQTIGSVTFGSAGISENSNDLTTGTKGYIYLRLRLINIDNIAHIRTTLVLKRI